MMLVPDAPQPSQELVMVLFSPRAPLKRQRLCASITICVQAVTHTHTHKVDVYLGRGHCQSSKSRPKNLSEQKRGKQKSGTKEACFAMFSSGSLGVFPGNRGSWGHRGREKKGESGVEAKDGDQ